MSGIANVVSFTVKGTNGTGNLWIDIKAQATLAGLAAADNFNKAFKLKASTGSAGGSSSGGGTSSSSGGGLLGNSSQGNSLINSLRSNANTPGGIGIIGAGSQGNSLISQLKAKLSSPGGVSLLGGAASGSSGSSAAPGAAGSSSGSSTTSLAKAIAGNTSSVNQNTSSNNNNTSLLAKVFGTSSGSSGSGVSSLAGKAAGFLSGAGSSGGGSSAGGVAGVLDSGGVAGGALPGMAGVSGMAATVAGLGATLVAVLPAITSVVAGLGAIGGGFAILMLTNKAFAAQMASTMSTIEGVFAKAAAPLAQPLEQAASSIAGYFTKLEPEFQAIFGNSAQLVAPLVKAIEGLVSGALPGFLDLIKAGKPVFDAFASSMSGLGKNLGSMLGDFAQASGGSATILSALMGLIGSLLPFIGDLAKVLVSAVAPAVAAFSKAFQSVLPALTPLISVIGSFAGAVLTDLAGVLGSVGTLLVDLAPSFTTLAKAASGVFTALENDGVFASLGNAIEGLAGPLAGLVNALVKALAPALPGIISAFSSFSEIFTGALVTVISGAANALTAIVKAIPPGVITAIADGFVAWYAAGKLLAPVIAAINLAMDANPIVLVGLAIAAIAAAFYLAWEKSALFRDVIKDIGSAMLGVGIIIIEGARDITGAFLDMVGAIIHGAADAFGWVPGLGGKLKGAASAFDGMKADVNNSFDSMISKMQGWQGDLNNAASTAKSVSGTISGDFAAQQAAASNASSALSKYSAAIKDNGVNSDQAKAARAQLIKDMQGAGVNAGTANKDVANYTTAVKDNGDKSSAAESARAKLISDILAVSKNSKNGQADLATFTSAVETNGSKSDAAKTARAQLIKDLENSGVNAKTATGLVDTLQSNIDAMHGKTVQVGVVGSGSGKITATENILGESSRSLGNLTFVAGGGKITGGIPGRDSVLGMLMPGELVVPAAMVQAGVVDHLRGKLPGFAGGGLLAGAGQDFEGSAASTFMPAAANAGSGAMLSAFLTAAAAAAAAQAKAQAQQFVSSGGASGGIIESMFVTLAAQRGWTGAQLNALLDVENREAGFNMTAQNPSSGAYGLAQFINGPSEYAQYGGNSTTAQGQITAMLNYISQRYGSPEGAWAHEVNYGWYDKGGWLKPGYTMAYNGTGSPEPVGAMAGGSCTHQVVISFDASKAGADKTFISALAGYMRNNGGAQKVLPQ